MDPAERIIFIGGDNLLSAALRNYIEQNTDIDCHLFGCDSLNELLQNDLAVINTCSIDDDSVLRMLSAVQSGHLCNSVAVTNVSEKEDVYKYIKWPVVKGIFNKDDSLDTLLNGLEALIRGGHWFSRKHTDILATLRIPPCSPHNSEIRLTEREMDILMLISSGLANQEIASHLSISPHTVKTHLYKAYKKLGIKNRFQATRWVQHNNACITN